MRLVRADVSRAAGDPAAIQGVVRAMDGFTDRLWVQLTAPDANLALSPYSIVSALAMATNGAASRTLRQMQDVLGIDDLASFNGGLNALTRAVEALAGEVRIDDQHTATIDLAAANQLFGDATTIWGKGFLDVLASEYAAGMRTVDFRNHPAAAETLINQWTSDQTHARIPTIIPPGTLDDLTRLVLVNALYLKAPWSTPFEASATSRQPFHRADGSAVDVDMMTGHGGGAYLEGDHFTGARLPYVGGKLAMTVALPDEGHDTEVLAALLAPGGLNGAGVPLLSIGLPKWKFRVAADLNGPLSSMGMGTAFTDGADFTRMSPNEPLHIGGVLHQTFISVDEAGTEAAAATAVIMEASGGQVGGGALVCDRPFLFVLHDTQHGVPLFLGRVADPS